MANPKKTTRSVRKKESGSSSRQNQKEITTAVHARSEDGVHHVVGIGNLRVMLFNDDGSWFAQGLEIDYFAQGTTREEVQGNFQTGLTATIDHHLKEHGHIRGVLQMAPVHVWKEVLTQGVGERFRYFQTSWHDSRLEVLPFAGVEFYERAA
jgi:hypothetical protein